MPAIGTPFIVMPFVKLPIARELLLGLPAALIVVTDDRGGIQRIIAR